MKATTATATAARPPQEPKTAAILVGLQVLFAALIVFSTSLSELAWYSWIGCGLGIALHLWAMWTMSFRRVRMHPAPGESFQLVTTGPYWFLRHPMYTALLLATMSLLPAPWQLWRGVLWLALLITLIVKSRVEETLITALIPEYPARMRSTWRLLPLIY